MSRLVKEGDTVRPLSQIIPLRNPGANTDSPEGLKLQFQYWRIRIFYTMLLGYVFYYFSRKSFTYAMPFLIDELGYTKPQLGIVTTVMAIAYGISKFTSGILVDRLNCRYLMGFGLIVTGIVNVFFGMTSSLVVFAVFWGINGWFQGLGAPSCAKLLVHWYRQKERGAWWSGWNTSHNLGSASIALIAAYCGQTYGWNAAFYVAGVVCVLAGLFSINRLRAHPEDVGLPPIDEMSQLSCSTRTSKKQEKLSVKEILFSEVLCNPRIFLLAGAYFFVYVLRMGLAEWVVLFLMDTKGYTALGAAATFGYFELGGFCGNLVAGWSSDRLFEGRRGPVNILFTIGAVLAISSLFRSVGGTEGTWIFLSGFFIFGPQMLVGVAAAELVEKRAAATANGFVGLFAYAGAAFAGWPLVSAAEKWGWEGFSLTLLVCGVIATLLLLPFWSHQSREATLTAAKA